MWALESGLRNTVAAQEAAGGGSGPGFSEGGVALKERESESDAWADLVDELPYLYYAAGDKTRGPDGMGPYWSDSESESESEPDTAAQDESGVGHRDKRGRGGSGSEPGRMDGASGF